MEIDVVESNGFWLPSVPLLISLYATAHAGEVLYVSPSGDLHTAEEYAEVVVPRPFVMRNLLVRTTGPAAGGEQPQPADGDLVVTLRKNGQDTPLSITIPRESTHPHTYLERSVEVFFSLGDRLSLKLKNFSGSGDSIVVGSIALDCGTDHGFR